MLLALTMTSSVAAAETSRPLNAGTAATGGPRIRASDSRVIDAIAEGIVRSDTFRTLLQRIEAQDVIAYVEMQPQLRGRLSGVMNWVIATGRFRYVRVGLNPEHTGSQLIATLAHELQHVREVGTAPSIVDTESLTAFYREVGTQRRLRSAAWETEAARRTGELVRRELASAVRVAKPIQPANECCEGGPAFAR